MGGPWPRGEGVSLVGARVTAGAGRQVTQEAVGECQAEQPAAEFQPQ